jgi:hypothetical protein
MDSLPFNANTAISLDEPQPKAVPATTMLKPLAARALNPGLAYFRQPSPIASKVCAVVRYSAGTN